MYKTQGARDEEQRILLNTVILHSHVNTTNTNTTNPPNNINSSTNTFNNNNNNNPPIENTVTSVNVGGPLNALSVSPDKTSVVVAGRETIKIVNLYEHGFDKNVTNLRVGKMKLDYTGNDCCWHPLISCKNLIATAATNGTVVIWNNAHIEKVIPDHKRSVNRIQWHPKSESLLLSGSQDSTMKLWDIRENPTATKNTFNGLSEVRDVSFSPFYPNYFAAGYDNGTVQVWDIRANKECARITAHQGLVHTIDWHPEDKDVLATGGRDYTIKVWNLKSISRPTHSISTTNGIARIKWRPESKWQIASCSTVMDWNVNIWDVQRPYIPIASLRQHRDVATGLVWYNSERLLSTSKDSTLCSQNIANAYRPYHHINVGGVTWNPADELASVNHFINRHAYDEEPKVDKQALTNTPSKMNSSLTTVNNNVPSVAKNEVKIHIHPRDACLGFDQYLFQYFAEHYRFRGADFMELCNHNMEVAEYIHQDHIIQMWKLLKIFFDPKYDTPKTLSPPSHDNGTVSVTPPTPTLTREPAFINETLLPSPISTPKLSTSNIANNNNINSNNAHNNNTKNNNLASASENHTEEDSLNFSLSLNYSSNDIFDSAPIDLVGIGANVGLFDGYSTEQDSLINLMSNDNENQNSDSPNLTSTPEVTQAHNSSVPPTSTSLSSNTIQHTNDTSKNGEISTWSPDSAIIDLLLYSANRGDVQTCVMVILILGPTKLQTLYKHYPS
eukprot:TRINITY_DN5118_c0_g1_i1.p1 TRINITY_DN5118_c0_g1~~TRINITY_DN5118_c0_g1_i1.p1  ORF type:complete len:728 (+),score=158.13 TRINITY_DN5118_c0_g1_i1:275-2458(+)